MPPPPPPPPSALPFIHPILPSSGLSLAIMAQWILRQQIRKASEICKLCAGPREPHKEASCFVWRLLEKWLQTRELVLLGSILGAAPLIVDQPTGSPLLVLHWERGSAERRLASAETHTHTRWFGLVCFQKKRRIVSLLLMISFGRLSSWCTKTFDWLFFCEPS